MRRILFFVAVLATAGSLNAQVADGQICEPGPPLILGQAPDPDFDPSVPRPTYGAGAGPRVMFDEFHSGRRLETSHAALAKVLSKDGYRLQGLRSPLTADILRPVSILLVVAAQAGPNAAGDWIPPVSAFQPEEIETLRNWIAEGGALFLNVDHLPGAGGSMRLARRLGILLNDGYATDAACKADEFEFRMADMTLVDHPITRGRDSSERVTRVRTITGTAFREAPGVTVDPILVLAPGSMILLPTQPWQWAPNTPRIPGEGMYQGAALTIGRGRLVVFGEVAMFTAQIRGPVGSRMAMGMNMPTADQNVQFLLNVMHWLDGSLPER